MPQFDLDATVPLSLSSLHRRRILLAHAGCLALIDSHCVHSGAIYGAATKNTNGEGCSAGQELECEGGLPASVMNWGSDPVSDWECSANPTGFWSYKSASCGVPGSKSLFVSLSVCLALCLFVWLSGCLFVTHTLIITLHYILVYDEIIKVTQDLKNYSHADSLILYLLLSVLLCLSSYAAPGNKPGKPYSRGWSNSFEGMTVEEANTKAIPHMSNTIQITVVCPDAVRGPRKTSNPTPAAPTKTPTAPSPTPTPTHAGPTPSPTPVVTKHTIKHTAVLLGAMTELDTTAREAFRTAVADMLNSQVAGWYLTAAHVEIISVTFCCQICAAWSLS